jgi:hypothetical protein
MICHEASKERYVRLLDRIIDRVRHEARSAETELVLAVRHMTPLAVGNKQLITAGLEESFERLHRASSSSPPAWRNPSRGSTGLGEPWPTSSECDRGCR